AAARVRTGVAGAAVAALVAFLLAVAADGGHARPGRRRRPVLRAGRARLDLAGRRAAVTVGRVAVVALLHPFDHAVAAGRNAGSAGNAAFEAAFDGLAVVRAAVAARRVAVVARLGRAEDAVAA